MAVGKWVKIPHGPATVSEERSGTLASSDALATRPTPDEDARHCARLSMGRRCRSAMIRESGNLPRRLFPLLARQVARPGASEFGAKDADRRR